MKTLDIILLLLLLFGAFRGFVKGMVMEVVGIIALTIAIWAGIELMDWGIKFSSLFTEDYKALVPFLSFFLIFLLVFMIITIGGRVLKGVLNLTMLGAVDNLAGAILGLLKWAFSISLIFWMAEGIGIPISTDIKENTVVYPLISNIGPATVRFLSANLPFMNDFFDSLKEIFQERN